MKQTQYCVFCLKKPATTWTGYVLKRDKRDDGERITAGWCAECGTSKKTLGFVGQFTDEMKTENIK